MTMMIAFMEEHAIPVQSVPLEPLLHWIINSANVYGLCNFHLYSLIFSLQVTERILNQKDH